MATYVLYAGYTSMVDVFSRTLRETPFSTNCTVLNSDGTTTSITGTNLVFVGGTFVSGTITSMTRWSADNLRVLDQLYDFNASNNSIAALWNTTTNEAARRYLFSQSDTFNIQSTTGSYINSGSGNDVINGGTGDDTIVFDLQNIGIDNINGAGSPFDMLRLSSTSGGAWLDMTYAGPDLWIKEGSVWRALAHVTSVEDVSATEFADQVYGDGVRNTLLGNGGTDTLNGRGGDDLLRGGTGADILYGESGRDSLIGDDGNDILNGGADDDFLYVTSGVAAGLDSIDGGSGSADAIEMLGFTDMAWVDLAAAGAEVYTKRNGAWQALANVVNVENVIGSEYNDEIWGNAGNNRLEGGNESDRIDGRAGADYIDGGEGYDFLRGGDGADTIFGGGMDDRIYLDAGFSGLDLVDGGLGFADEIDCSSFATKAWVDLTYSGAEVFTIVGGVWKAIANVTGIEFVRGSAFADELYGDGGTNQIVAGAGNDIIAGRGGDDYLYGGLGSDIFKYALSGNGTFDFIHGFDKGAVGVGDKIDFAANLSIQLGSSTAFDENHALIDPRDGIASFFAGSGTTLPDALNDVGNAIAGVAGSFAFFKVFNTGSYYMYLSDGIAGYGPGDTYIVLIDLTSINSISLAGGDLTILT